MIENSTSGRAAVVRRITGACGIMSQLVGLTVLLVVISNSPWFSWTENHISVFGVEGSAKTLFNGGLILAGIFGLIFAIGLGRCLLSGRLGQLAVASLFCVYYPGSTPYRRGGNNCFANGVGITEHHRRCPRGCHPASSRAIKRWCYCAAAFLLAVVVVDDSPWGCVVGKTYFVGV